MTIKKTLHLNNTIFNNPNQVWSNSVFWVWKSTPFKFPMNTAYTFSAGRIWYDNTRRFLPPARLITSTDPAVYRFTSGSFYSPSHEWILSHDVSHASEQRSASNKTACPKPRIYVDGWMKPNPESPQSMIVVILFVIHLDLLPSPIPTQSLRLVVDYKHCYQPSREWRGYGDRETDRATDSGLKI